MKENKGNYHDKFHSDMEQKWDGAWKRFVVKADFLSLRMGDTRALLFADGDPGVKKKLMMQEIKRLIHQGREGSGPGPNGRMVLPQKERPSF